MSVVASVSSVAARRLWLQARAWSTLSREQAVRLVAFLAIASPAAAVAYLFVVAPEAMGSPIAKLGLMLVSSSLLMAAGDLSRTFTTWALARWDARSVQEQAPFSSSRLQLPLHS